MLLFKEDQNRFNEFHGQTLMVMFVLDFIKLIVSKNCSINYKSNTFKSYAKST